MVLQRVPSESAASIVPEKFVDISGTKSELIKMSEAFRWKMQQLVERAQHKLLIVLDELKDYDKYLEAVTIINMHRLLAKKRSIRRKKIKELKKEIKLAIKLKKPLKIKRLKKALKKVIDVKF